MAFYRFKYMVRALKKQEYLIVLERAGLRGIRFINRFA